MKAYELIVCESYQVCEGWLDTANTNDNIRVSLLGCYIHKADGQSSKRRRSSSCFLCCSFCSLTFSSISFFPGQGLILWPTLILNT